MADDPSRLNPAATDHLPWFVVSSGESDVLMTAAGVFLVILLFVFGTLYLRLHALPDHIAHRTSKVQMQIVGVLTLVALVTHNNAFWIAALLLALIDLPDIGGALSSMAKSLSRMAPTEVPPGPATATVEGGPRDTAPVVEPSVPPVGTERA